ncbi:MAG TPA: hypothetical protein VF711_00665, partial [Acidimicrobiales bacterium]
MSVHPGAARGVAKTAVAALVAQARPSTPSAVQPALSVTDGSGARSEATADVAPSASLATIPVGSSSQDAELAPVMTTAAGAAPVAVSQCNGTDNVGGRAVECHVTVTNNLDLATGLTSSSVTVEECHGAANAAPTCTTTITPSDQLVSSVDQCNGSGNGGGGTVTCSVEIINNITGSATPTSITVNQCNASGTGGGTEPTTDCDPFPANTTNATVTQCNDAGTGGGGTMRVKCTVLPGSTEVSALPVTVNQCNGSGNGGGGYVTCTVSVTNNVIPAPPPVITPPPVIPAPVIPAPVIPAPVIPAPVIPAPVIPAPVIPAPSPVTPAAAIIGSPS